MNRTTFISGVAIVVAAVASPAFAANNIGSFKQWNAYSSTEGGGKTCFIASQPSDSKYKPNSVKSRDAVFFMITTIPAKNIRNEASTIIGYPFKEASKVTVTIDDAKFTMFTDKDSAWIENPTQEDELIEAMKKGTKMVVEGTSRRGTTTIDSYSLSGVTAALDAIAKECPMQAATQ